MTNHFLKYSLFTALILNVSVLAFAGCESGVEKAKDVPATSQGAYLERTILGYQTKSKSRFINNNALFKEGWDTLSHVRFWQEIMNIPHDSVLLNVAGLRKPLFTLHAADWSCQSIDEKDEYKRLICISNDLSSSTSIYATAGKEHFFEFRKVLPMIPVAIDIFEQEGTDPWYAQTILLIESPGKKEAVSYAGARGAFQLMPSVARSQGLVVNQHRDDRTDLRLSAAGAARLIRKVCLSEARRLLNRHSIAFNEQDLWFRLFVMHIYHSGAGNLSAALNAMQPTEGGMGFIQKLWRTEAAGFKNESQNYSQVALAAMVTFDRLLNAETDSDTVYLVHGDKYLLDLKDGRKVCVDTVAYLTECMQAYGTDLVEGVIPVAYYFQAEEKVVGLLKRHCAALNTCSSIDPFRRSDRFAEYATKLITKRKLSDAIALLEKSLQLNPWSISSYNLIISAYNKDKNLAMVDKYTEERKLVIKNPLNFKR